MFATNIVLDKPLPLDYATELERRVFFVSDAIVNFRLLTRDDLVYGVDVTTSAEVDTPLLAAKLNAVVTNEVIPQRIIPAKQIWKADHSRPTLPNMFEQMVEREIAWTMGEGQISVGEPFITLMDYFDRRLRAIAIQQLNAKEYRYPTLIPTKALQKCGYFNSFPHFLMFVTRLHNDLETYQSFLAEYQDKQSIDSYVLSHCHNTDYCLPPTMCYHTYHQYSGRRLNEGENLVVTARGKSFRFESRYHQTLERLWDFTIREIVFIGSRQFVLACRQQFMEHTFQLINELGLTGFCEVANDPFFCNQDTAERIWSQKVLELKYELRLNVAPNRTIAVGSFNFHDSFFGESFAIGRGEREWARSACIGFGLERLVYAFLCQYGLEPQHWPDAVAEGVRV